MTPELKPIRHLHHQFGGFPELEAPSCMSDDAPSLEPQTDGTAQIMWGISIVKWRFCRLRTNKVKSGWTAVNGTRNTRSWLLIAHKSLHSKEIVHLKNIFSRKQQEIRSNFCILLLFTVTDAQLFQMCPNYIFRWGRNRKLKMYSDGFWVQAACEDLDSGGGFHSNSKVWFPSSPAGWKRS